MFKRVAWSINEEIFFCISQDGYEPGFLFDMNTNIEELVKFLDLLRDVRNNG